MKENREDWENWEEREERKERVREREMKDLRGERDAKSWVYGLGMRERQRVWGGYLGLG